MLDYNKNKQQDNYSKIRNTVKVTDNYNLCNINYTAAFMLGIYITDILF